RSAGSWPLRSRGTLQRQQFVHARDGLGARQLLAQVDGSVVASDVWPEPLRVLPRPHARHLHLPLNLEVAALAERDEIPPAAVVLAAVQVMDGEDPPLGLSPRARA